MGRPVLDAPILWANVTHTMGDSTHTMAQFGTHTMGEFAHSMAPFRSLMLRDLRGMRFNRAFQRVSEVQSMSCSRILRAVVPKETLAHP